MTIYLVRRFDGTFVKYGFNWTIDMQKAAIYPSIGPARSRVTRWSRMHPKEPLLTILAFTFTEADAIVLDQTKRTFQLNKAKQQRDQQRKQERDKEHKQWLLEERADIERQLSSLP